MTHRRPEDEIWPDPETLGDSAGRPLERSKPTLRDLILECFAVGREHGHEFEQLPLDLVRRLVYFGLDDDPNDPDDKPGDGAGVLSLLMGPGGWGAKPAPMRTNLGPSEDVTSPVEDPAGDYWRGRPKRSGKHFNDGGRQAPYGGLGIPHLDSGALADVYHHFGRPAVSTGKLFYDDGSPVAFDTLRRRGGSTWERWLDWSTPLVADPEFAVWSVRYWLREFWFPIWDETEWSNDDGLVWKTASDSVVARFSNSAKYEARKHIGKAAKAVQAAYRDYKLKSRGEGAADRADRQSAYAQRAPEAMAAVMIRAL